MKLMPSSTARRNTGDDPRAIGGRTPGAGAGDDAHRPKAEAVHGQVSADEDRAAQPGRP